MKVFRTKDIEAVRKLDATLWAEAYTDDFVGHELWLAKNDAGKLVGYASLQLVDGGSAAFLAKSGVLWEARGHGLQKRFIKARERRAKELGAKRTVTYTSDDNLASINSLIACGYKMYRPTYSWGLPFGKGGLYWFRSL